jgi:hypothetical protein
MRRAHEKRLDPGRNRQLGQPPATGTVAAQGARVEVSRTRPLGNRRIDMNKSVRNYSIVCAFTLSLSSLGCSGGGIGAEAEGDLGQSQQELNQGYPLWPSGNVPVCFTQATVNRSDFAGLRDRMRDNVQKTWMRAAKLDIWGWNQTCGANTNGKVVIEFKSNPDGSWPCDGRAGRSSDPGYHSGAPTPVCVNAVDAFFDGISVHEMGHALGMGHEHDRNDWTLGCAGNEPSDLSYFGTPANDAESIMEWAYCGRGPSVTLSPWDTVGIQNAYGRKAPGSLVNNGLCLDIPNGVYVQGQALQVYDCQGAANQKWRSYADGTMNAPGLPPSYLDVRGAGGAGSVVQVYAKNSPVSLNQTFGPINTQIKTIGDLCIDVPGPNYQVGQTLQQYTCNNGNNQKWYVLFIDSSTVQFQSVGNTNLCIASPTGAVSGSLLTLQSCNWGDTKQRFNLTAAGEIKSGGYCWDMQWGDVTNGRLLQLFTCKTPTDPTQNYGKANELFYFRGPVLTGLGTYLSSASDTPKVNDPVTVQTSGTASRAIWDYYFNP